MKESNRNKPLNYEFWKDVQKVYQLNNEDTVTLIEAVPKFRAQREKQMKWFDRFERMTRTIYTSDAADWIANKLKLNRDMVEAILDAEAIFQVNHKIIDDPDGSFVAELEEHIKELMEESTV